MAAGTPSRPDDRSPRAALLVRARLVGTAIALGAAGGAVFVVAATLFGRSDAIDAAFLAGTVAFGFGLLGWSGSVMAGRGIEAMQTHLDTGSDWTERKSRRAMARIGGAGFGTMIGVAVAGTAL